MVSANYGVTRGAFNLEYIGMFHQLIGSWDFLLKSRFDDPAVENYFGTGNETIKPSSRTYNRTKGTRFYFGTGISRMLADNHHVEFSVFYQMVKVKKTAGHFIAESPEIDSSVFSNKKFIGADAGYRYRKVNDNNFATKGFDFSLGLGYIKTLNENKSFAKILSSFSFYLPLGKSFSFAARIGVATQGSDADYYHLSKLGGYVNLRGYLRERFYGTTIFYNNNELRWVTPARISRYTGKVGLLGFFDDGRVWQPGEISNTMHTGYGGGIIVIPANKIALTATVTHSKENSLIELKAGMFF
jgi:hemolysin activation/secretion protein